MTLCTGAMCSALMRNFTSAQQAQMTATNMLFVVIVAVNHGCRVEFWPWLWSVLADLVPVAETKDPVSIWPHMALDDQSCSRNQQRAHTTSAKLCRGQNENGKNSPIETSL